MKWSAIPRFGAALARWHVLDVETNFSDGNYAGKQIVWVGVLKSQPDGWIGIKLGELGNDVRIDEETVQNSTRRG